MWTDLFKYNILDEIRLLKKKITITTHLQFRKKCVTCCVGEFFLIQCYFPSTANYKLVLGRICLTGVVRLNEFLERDHKSVVVITV